MTPDLVGRDAELEVIARRVATTGAGRGGVFLLAGEPGIGKTRMAQEAAELARQCGLRAVWGRCRETGDAPPYWPWTQVLRAVLAEHPPEGATAKDLEPLLRAEPARHADRFRTFDAVTRVLVERAEPDGLVVVLDDLHRADRSSLLLLRFVAAALAGSSLLLIGTYRPGEITRTHALGAVIGEAAGEGLDLLELAGLGPAATAALAERAGKPPAAAAELHRRCGGNPFFLTELLRSPAGPDDAVPATVSAAVTTRAARLPRRTREALAAAAVVGRDASVELVAALTGQSAASVDAALAPAVAAGLLTAAPGVYRFPHVLVREALYAALPGNRRIELHDRAVRVLGSSDVDQVDDLADHAARAVRSDEDRRRAERLAVRAGDLARRRLADAEAADWYERALGLSADADRFDLLVALGRSASGAGQVARARTAYQQAWQLAATQQDSARMAQAALGSGDAVVSAGTVDAVLVRLLEQTLDRLDPADRHSRIRLTARLAVELYWGPELPRARLLASEAVAAARRLADDRTLGVTLAAQQYALRGPDRLAERIRLGQELVSLARRLGDEELELWARRLLMPDQFQVDPVAADAELAALTALADQTRRPLARWYVVLNRCLGAIMTGDTAAALRLVSEVDALGRRIDVQPVDIYVAGQRYAALRQLGRGDEAEDDLRRIIAAYPVLATVRCLLAVLLAEAARDDEAHALLDELAANDCAAVRPDALWLSSLALLAITAVRLDRPDHAATLHRLLLPHSGEVVVQGVVVWWGAVDHYLGLAAMVLGRWDEAQAWLRAGLRTHEAWAAGPFVDASLQALADLARRRGATTLTDREREVLALLSAGAANKEIARRLGISVHTVERHVANLYGKIGARNRADATAFALRSTGV